MYLGRMYLGLYDFDHDTEAFQLFEPSAWAAAELSSIVRAVRDRMSVELHDRTNILLGTFQPEDCEAIRDAAEAMNAEDARMLREIAKVAEDRPHFRFSTKGAFPELREPLYDYD